MKTGKLRTAILFFIVFIFGAGAGYGLCSITSSSSEISGQSSKYEKVEELYQIIKKDFYKAPDEKKLVDGMCRGLFSGLGDEYSYYMTKDELESYEISVSGEFEGVGITFQQNKEGDYVVVSVVKKSPAERAGFKQGDILLQVDGKRYDNDEVMAGHIRGRKGTKVTITYMRNKKKHKATMIRDKIIMESVESKVLPNNIGYIKISAFENNTAGDFSRALDSMEEKKVKGVIIDLRDNGGGLVDSGVNIADELLGKCIVTYMEDRSGNKEYYRSGASCTDLPYVLIVNGNTASTSEILSAAVKDKGNGKLVGTRTFGKGVVQISDKLKDGSGYRLTIRQYFSPDGKKIHEKGVTPQYVVKGKKNQLKKAEELILKAD